MYIFTITKLHFLIINMFIIFIFALLYKKYGNPSHFYFRNKKDKMNMTDSLYFSLNTYSTIGYADVYPKSDFMKKIIMAEIVCLISMIILLGCSNIEIIQK